MKTKILFVDDDANVLGGLRRLLRHKRQSWDMHFANGGPEAVDLFSQFHFDVIVTDMRMPQINGSQLLKIAKDEGQGVVRFVLSGEADLEMTCNTVGLSHQFFAKPCDPAFLISQIEEPLFALNETNMRGLGRDLADLEALPTTSSSFEALLDAICVQADLDAVTSVISRDPAMVLRILQLANSAYFGRPCRTLSIAKAVERVGLLTLERLTKLDRFCVPYEQSGLLEPVLEQALETARSLTVYALDVGADTEASDMAYAVGMLSWLGELLEATGTCELVGNRGKRSAQISSYLSVLFGLPDRLSRTLTHYSAICVGQDTAEARARGIGQTMFLKAVA